MVNAAQTPNFSSFGTSGQAATPAYGQPNVTVNPMPAQPAAGGVQWGKIVKGALVITAVAVAAVVAGWAVYSLANAVLGVGTVNTILGTTVHYAGVALQYLAGLAGQAFGFISGAVGQIAANIGIGTYGLAAAPAAHGAGLVAGVVTAAASVPLVGHIINPTDTPAPVGADHSATTSHALVTKAGMASASVDPHMSHTFNDMTHHAGEHSAEHKSFAERHSNRAAFTSHADAVRASQGERSAPTPRSASFSEQLNADRASLENSLGTQIT